MTDHQVALDDETVTIPLLRSKDVCLMEAFMKNNLIQKSTLGVLNRCRMYLKVFTLADITNSSGTKLRNDAWNGRQYHTSRDTEFQWPTWGRPSLQSWAMWRTALKVTFCKDTNGRALTTKLLDWIKVPVGWKWFAVKTNNEYLLVEKTLDSYVHYKKIGRSKLMARYDSKVQSPYLPDSTATLLPTTVEFSHNAYIMDQPYEGFLKPPNKKTSKILTSWLNVAPYRQGSESKLANDIKKGRAIAVCDGSYSSNRGIATASWIITSGDKASSTTAACISPGSSEIQSSYRAEILGLLGILEKLHSICSKWNITQGKCIIFCDGISALEMVESATRQTVNTRMNSCDLLSACAALNELIPIELKYQHVKGHQDSTTNFSKLSFPSQLNVLMDGLAKDALHDANDNAGMNLPGHQLGLHLPSCQGSICYHKFKPTLYTAIMTTKAHNYWIDAKQRYSRADIPSIDWSTQYSAFKSLRSTRQRTLTKWFSGWLGTGINMQRWKLRYSGNCPFCGQNNEDTNHVLLCSHSQSQLYCKEQFKEYDAKLTKCRTTYPLRKAILLELYAWRSQQPPPKLQFADEELKKAVLRQRNLGWRLFLEGLVVKEIISYQRDHMSRHQPNRSCLAWSKKLMNASWGLLMDIWTFRNESLHEPHVIQELEGRQQLDDTIFMQWNRGLGPLPPHDFSHLFRIKIADLQNKSIEGKKDWLATVKLGREMHEDTLIHEDIFDTNDALRFWIGLPQRTTTIGPKGTSQ